MGLAAASRVQSPSSSSHPITQIVLATAHPAKFSEAVTQALSSHSTFDFERDVLPKEFQGLLERKRRFIDVEGPDPEFTKKVVIEQVGKLFGAMEQSEATASV